VGNEKKKKDKVKKGATYFMMKGIDGSYINPNMAVASGFTTRKRKEQQWCFLLRLQQYASEYVCCIFVKLI
jgi:hypothetical protein